MINICFFHLNIECIFLISFWLSVVIHVVEFIINCQLWSWNCYEKNELLNLIKLRVEIKWVWLIKWLIRIWEKLLIKLSFLILLCKIWKIKWKLLMLILLLWSIKCSVVTVSWSLWFIHEFLLVLCILHILMSLIIDSFNLQNHIFSYIFFCLQQL